MADTAADSVADGGFVDDDSIGGDGSGLELTDREVAIAEGRDPDEPVEDLGGGDESSDGDSSDADGTDSGEGGQDDDKGSWITDDLVSVSETYGLSREDLDEFGSQEEFFRAARFFEKRNVQGTDADAASGSDGKDAGASQEEPREPEDHPSTENDGRPKEEIPKIDPEFFDREGYDEQTVAMARAVAYLQDKFQGVTAELEATRGSFDEYRQQATLDAFHTAADKVGGRFGSSDSLTDEQYANREKLYEAAGRIASHASNAGQQLPSPTVLLRRAELLAFGDEVLADRDAAIEKAKAEQKQELAERVKKQSSKRRPAGRATATAKKEPPVDDDPISAIANSPELVEFWNENQL